MAIPRRTPWDSHIYRSVGVVLGVNVCKYASPMECLGLIGSSKVRKNLGASERELSTLHSEPGATQRFAGKKHSDSLTWKWKMNDTCLFVEENGHPSGHAIHFVMCLSNPIQTYS